MTHVTSFTQTAPGRAVTRCFPVLMLLALAGCSLPVHVDHVDTQTAYAIQTRNALSAGEPSEASKKLLRRQGLLDRWDTNPTAVLAELHRGLNPAADIERLFVLSELSFLNGERTGDHAVNIGERVRFVVTGWLPEHKGAARFRNRDLTGEIPRIPSASDFESSAGGGGPA
jgi:hypothetical protein